MKLTAEIEKCCLNVKILAEKIKKSEYQNENCTRKYM
jgi:hypothetical protein